MRGNSYSLSLLSSLALFANAVPTDSPSLTFVSPSKLSPGRAQNIVVQYSGNVDGQLTLVYGSCESDAAISEAKQHIGATHVGQHPLAKRHVDHHEQRPTSFVWVVPDDVSDGCLQAFLDDSLIGKSERLVAPGRLRRRSKKKSSFADVAGEDGLWFDGVAYLKQKQPDDIFVTATKKKTFGILGGGISGLMSSVSQPEIH